MVGESRRAIAFPDATRQDVPVPPAVDVTVVVPAFDEAPNLARLLAETHAALDPMGLAWELLIVDDGSDDGTPALLARLAAADARLRTVRLPQRSGQTAALASGFRSARGRLIATLDADLQCAPADLAGLLMARGDADLACGIRAKRDDPFSRRVASVLANIARRLLVAPAVRDLACPLRVFRADALAKLERLTPLFDGAHRWLPALFVLAGLRVVQRPVAHRARTAGVSKYTTRGRLLPVLRELGEVVALVVRQSPRRRRAIGLGLLALAALPFLYALGAWPLMEPDEGRNAEVAREMLALGQWSVPHFNGLPYLDKPVLLFWTIAAAFRLGGVGETTARLPSALAALATVALTYDLGRLLLGWRRAVLAAAIVATAPIVLAYARLVIFDMLLTALVTAVLCCLVRARLEGRPWRWLPLAGVAMGLATLTKGPVGIAVPLLAWGAGRGALPPPPRRGGPGPIVAAALALALVVVPWLALVERQEPGFLRYAVLDETLLRLVSPERFHRGGPVYFYAETLAWALGAWGIVLAALTPTVVGRWRASARDGAVIAFAARAAGALVLFFTLSASKRPHYILPAVVPLALLAAAGIAADPERAAAAVRMLARWLVVAGAAALVAGLADVSVTAGEFRVLSAPVLIAVGLCLVLWGVGTATSARRPAAALACCALLGPGLGLALLRPLAAYADSRSSRRLAAEIDPEAVVVCFDSFRSSLPFYLRRPITLASDSPRALASNYIVALDGRRGAPHGEMLIPTAALPAVIASGTPLYVVASRWNAEELTRLSPRPLVAVNGDGRSILFRPRG